MIIIILSFLNQGDNTSVVYYNNTYYVQHRYTTVGNHTFISGIGGIFIDYLIMGGGGGGGSRHSGGGGAGGIIIASKIFIPEGNYSLIIGDGGFGGYGELNGVGDNGQDSSFFGEIAKGGGGGGSYSSFINGRDGGSGGGGAFQNGKGGKTNKNGSLRGISYGNNGGDEVFTNDCNGFLAGGGGGAGGPGLSGNNLKGGNGGPGIQWIDGNYYGGGGGGSVYQAGKAGNGGVGGGGGGSSYVGGERCSNGGTIGYGSDGAGNGQLERIGTSCVAGNAAPNTGGGGGGASQNFPPDYGISRGGNGGSGIIVIIYSDAPLINQTPVNTHIQSPMRSLQRTLRMTLMDTPRPRTYDSECEMWLLSRQWKSDVNTIPVFISLILLKSVLVIC